MGDRLMAYGVGDYGGDQAAELTYRDLYLAQWEDYQERFLPYQELLLDTVASQEMLDQQLSRITAVGARSTELSRDFQQKNLARYGMTQTAGQTDSFEDNLAMNEAMSVATAQNQARDAAYDRYNAAMTGAGLRPQVVDGSTGGGGTT